MDEPRKKTELHISTVGETYSFRPVGSRMEDRAAIFSALRYGSGPDAVLVSYGIQGQDYLRGLQEHFHEISSNVVCCMGYVFERHLRVYQRALRGLADVEVLFRGRPYGEDGPVMPWVVVWRKGERRNGRGQQDQNA